MRDTSLMLTWNEVRAFAEGLPGAEQSTSYGTPALKVTGKLFARLLEDGESIVVKIDPFDRDVLTAQKPDRFVVTPHYRDWPLMIVRLAVADAGEVRELVVGAWRYTAPVRAVAAWDAGQR
jgi:hypothetical protein